MTATSAELLYVCLDNHYRPSNMMVLRSACDADCSTAALKWACVRYSTKPPATKCIPPPHNGTAYESCEQTCSGIPPAFRPRP